MASYYKTINGIQYDRAMLDVADKSVQNKKDGRISLADAKKIITKASDAGKITEIEARSLNYIFEHYKFTKSAEEYFSNFSSLEKGEKTITGENVIQTDEDIFGIKEFVGKYYLYFIIIALVIFLLYVYSDKLMTPFSKTAEIKQPEPAVQTTPKIDAKTEESVKPEIKPEVKTEVAGQNEYIVQHKDTLFDISKKLYGDPAKWKALYDRNKDIIPNPTMIYPGQKLKTDIK